MPLVRRQLAVIFDLGEGSFGESGFNRVQIGPGLRASAVITNSGGPSFSMMDLTISGMTLSDMNKLSTLGRKIRSIRKNVVSLLAGDVDSGLAAVFAGGQIIEAWTDFSGMPNSVFHVSAGHGQFEAIKPIPPTSYRGLVDVATVLKGLASQAGWTFSNDGVTFQLIDPYFPGTLRTQVEACAEAAGINWTIENNTLAIWPRGGARGGQILLVSPQTGLQGYPAFTSSGIQLSMLYSPSINFGQRIQVQSAVTPANGVWQIQTLAHHLESETPGGQWTTRMIAIPPELFATSSGPLTAR